MRILIAGASGAIGTRLVRRLVEREHEVIGTYTTPGKGERVRAVGGDPVKLDLLDAAAVRRVVLETRPDAVVHQATALSEPIDFRHFDRSFAQTNRLRTAGTDALIAAAREAGVERLVAQSYASARYARTGSWVKTEDDPLDSDPPRGIRESFDAMAYLDRTVVEAGGAILRYGGFYGDDNDQLPVVIRKRQFPIVADGAGVTSFIHLEDAAAATVLAIEQDARGVYHVVDDEPARARVWLPAAAEILGAKPPRRVPRWLARLFAGEAAVMMGTESRGASNAKAKRELGWTPIYPSWREGFAATYVAAPNAEERGSHPTARASHSTA